MNANELADVKAVEPYVLEISFGGGARARVDVSAELYGEVFEPLRDPTFFAQARFDQGAGTVVWPNGADFSPEFLIELALAASS